MEITLQLKDLYLGNIDAKNELLKGTEEERSLFSESFFMPPNIVMEHFVSGRKYFITGLKGTGKTALLRYISIAAEEKLKAICSFILFKSEFNEQDRKDFSKAARTFVIENNAENYEEQDYEDIWKWFLHRHIVKILTESPNKTFVLDDNWKKYAACVNAPKIGDEESGISRLFPRLKRGNVEISGGAKVINGKLGLEFDWEDKNNTTVKFSNIVKQADTLFERLTPKEGNIFIFLDELELTLGNNKKYIRDVKMIRDLIIAIENINGICKRKGFSIKILCAVRSEVISAIESSGKEINKIITDFGTPIRWDQSGGDKFKHPIIQLLIQRITATEKHYGLKTDKSFMSVWNRYFTDKQIQGKDTPDYILHQTWYRPRDIVRLLSLAQNFFPESKTFSHQIFDAIRKQYSKDSWIEITEELRANYTDIEIDGIKKILSGRKRYFSFKDLNEHIDKIKDIYGEVDVLLNKRKIGSVLSDAYRVGILGNTGKKVRFAFRGDEHILLDKMILVHSALHPVLSIE